MNIRVHRLDPRVPDPVESRRSGAGRLVRFVYAAGVLGVIGFFVLRFGAPLVLLGGNGVVWAPTEIVSRPVVVQVLSVDVKPGSVVKAGDPIALVASAQVTEMRTKLMQSMSDLTGREAEMRVRARVAESSIEAARMRLRVADEAMRRLEAEAGRSSSSMTYRAEVYRERAQAVQNVAALEAEAAESSAQLARMAGERNQLQEVLDHIDQRFEGGRVSAPVDGIVSENLSRNGEVILAGSSIAEIYRPEESVVMWSIPNFRLHDPRLGQEAFVVFGKTRLRGTIEEILPISSVFRGGKGTILNAPEATQVARIRLDPRSPPPAIGSVVRIHMYYTEAVDRVLARVLGLLGLS